MAVTIEEFFQRFQEVPRKLEQTIIQSTAPKIFETIQEHEEDVFEEEKGPQSEWPSISTISFLTRETDPRGVRTFRDADSLIREAQRAKPLVDTGELLNEATTEDGIQEVDVTNTITMRFGTTKGEKHQEGGRTASGLDSDMVERALIRAPSGTARALAIKLLSSLAESSGGQIPQRQFLFIDDETLNRILDDLEGDLVTTLAEILGR